MDTRTQSNHAGWTALAGTVAAFMLSLSTPAIAAAAGADNTRSITVSYAELDISKPQGAKVLYHRIQRAALVVCDEYRDPHRTLRTRTHTCYQDAVANAVTDVNSALLYAIHRERTTRVASN